MCDLIYHRGQKYLFVSNILCWPFFFVKYFEYYHCELLMALDWISLITISQNSGKDDIKINTLILSSKFISTWLGWHVIIIVTRAQIFTTLKGRNYKEYKRRVLKIVSKYIKKKVGIGQSQHPLINYGIAQHRWG